MQMPVTFVVEQPRVNLLTRDDMVFWLNSMVGGCMVWHRLPSKLAYLATRRGVVTNNTDPRFESVHASMMRLIQTRGALPVAYMLDEACGY